MVCRVVARQSAGGVHGAEPERSAADGEAPAEPARYENLSTFDLQVFPSDWSLDGKYLAYTASRPGHAPMTSGCSSMTGARKAAPLLQSPFSECHAQFSPDGRWLAFTSNETGRDDVYVQSFPDAGTRRIVSSAWGAYPRWGPGGRELFYRAPDGRSDDRSGSARRVLGGTRHALRRDAAGGCARRPSVSVRRRARTAASWR